MSWHRWGIAFASMAMAVLARVAAQTAQTDDVTLRLIVVASADEAQRVVEKLRQGESFVTLARSLSIDPTAETGAQAWSRGTSSRHLYSLLDSIVMMVEILQENIGSRKDGRAQRRS